MADLNKELLEIKQILKNNTTILSITFPSESTEIRRDEAQLFLKIRRLVNDAYAQGKEDCKISIERNFKIIKNC